jgi:transcriptional regulator with XRE-family HTH domain
LVRNNSKRMTEVSEFLKKVRLRDDMTQAQLAKKLGITVKSVNRYENGEPVSKKVLEKLTAIGFKGHRKGQKDTDPSPAVVNEDQVAYIKIPVDHYIAKLESDKETLKNSIQVSLSSIDASQAVMLKILEQVFDHTLDIKATVQKRSKAQVVLEAGRSVVVGGQVEHKGSGSIKDK